MKRSRLSEIPGLGPKRVKELLAHFRSIDAIQLASPEQLAAAPGLGPALARQVWEYFHGEPQGESEDCDAEGAHGSRDDSTDAMETEAAAGSAHPGVVD